MNRDHVINKELSIQASFDSSLTSSLLLDTSIDLTEASIDQLLSSEATKHIPIVKTIAGFIQMGLNIQDRLFLKKILAFLQNIDSVPEHERKKVIEEIDNSGKYRIKVGEKLLYILDSCDDHVHSENVAKLFSAMLKGKITYDEYVDAAQIVSRISQDSLNLFLSSYRSSRLDNDASTLLHTGLVFTEVEEVRVEIEKHEPGDWDEPPEYYDATTHGGQTIIWPTSAGDTVFEVFGMGRDKLTEQMKKETMGKKVKLRDARIGSVK